VTAAPPVTYRSAGGGQLDAATLYGLLRLRAEVFVVEQASPYLDPDGRDLDGDTVHLWAEDEDGDVVGCVRIVPQPTGVRRIGRVVAAKPWRGTGLAAELVRRAVESAGADPIVLDAQAHLEAWYARLGFVRTGPVFDEDGIAHVPMRRR
jgi:ElaA protein